MRFLRWPWDEIFAERNFSSLIDDVRRSTVRAVPSYTSFESHADKCGILQGLSRRSMMGFLPYAEVENGMFGVMKPSGKQRLLVDLRPANSMMKSMDGIQELYTSYLDAKGGWEECGLPARALDYLSPSVLAEMDARVCGKSQSDLSDFFHFISLPSYITRYFTLSPIAASEVGVQGGGLVYPMCTTLPMGWIYAPLLAQLVHESVLMCSLTRPVRFLKPEFTSPGFRERYNRLSLSVGGGWLCSV